MTDTTYEDDLLEDRIKTNVLDPVLFRRMAGYCKPYWFRSLVGFGLMMVLAFFAVVPPALIGGLVDVVFSEESSWLARQVSGVLSVFIPGLPDMSQMDKLLVFAGLFLFVRLSAFFIEWINGYLLAGLGQRIIYDLRMQLFEHIHSLSLSYFHRQPVGRLVTRTANDVAAMEEMFSTAFVAILKDIGMLLGIVVFLLVINVQLGLITMSVIPLMVIATLIFRRFARTAYRQWRAALSRMNAFTAETLGGVRVVQLFHKESVNDATYRRINDDYRTHFLRQRTAWAIFRPANTTLSAVGIGLVLWFGGAAVLSDMSVAAGMTGAEVAAANLFTIGLLFAFIGYAELFFTPIRDLTEKFDVVQGAMTSAERIFTIMDEKADIVDLPGAKDFGRVKGDVEFQDVEFEYVRGEKVLKSVNFRIPAGSTVAIVGHTGAGKTTIINLVTRFYDIQGGSVRVDSRDVREYTLKSLRRNVAVVHQDVFLFAGTVLDNVRLGNEAIPRERVEEACRAVGADAFIRRLEGGYDARVEEGGKTFSAGERQLLSFARALVFDPAILILDEATSSVDTHTEELIQQALTELTRGRTSMVIAHRLSTVQKADVILVMHKGKLAEQGTHQELLARRGIYYKLYQLQYKALEGAPQPPKAEPAESGPPQHDTLRSAAASTRTQAADPQPEEQRPPGWSQGDKD
jgi:ATP-binding cassette, subfamily B, multidrug efflux pump